MNTTGRSFNRQDTFVGHKAELDPYRGINIPGVGYAATKHAKEERNSLQAQSGARKAEKFVYQNQIYSKFVGSQVRYKKKEEKLFDLLEDKLDEEKERERLIEYEKEERMNTMQSNETGGSHNKMISRDASSFKSKKELEAEAKLPDIGSYKLIQDVMNGITTTNIKQKELEERQDVNSKRAYLNRTADRGISLDMTQDPDKKSIIEQWGIEADNFNIGHQNQLRMHKGMCHNDRIGRFTTSAKEWLSNRQVAKPKSQRAATFITGQAMFNLNRTLPKPDKGAWNQNIRRNVRTQRNNSPASNVQVELGNTYDRLVDPLKLGSGDGQRTNLLALLGNTAQDVQYAEAMKLIKL